MNNIRKIFKAFVHGPIYVILFGMIFFGIGGVMTYRQFTIQRQGLEAQGEVTGYTMGSCDDDGCTYKSNVRFETQNGQSVSFLTTFSSSPPAFDVGEKVTVYYLPDNLEKAFVKGEGKVFRIVFISIGGVIIAAGVFFFGKNIANSFWSDEEE